jgi:hypothetical protein
MPPAGLEPAIPASESAADSRFISLGHWNGQAIKYHNKHFVCHKRDVPGIIYNKYYAKFMNEWRGSRGIDLILVVLNRVTLKLQKFCLQQFIGISIIT